MALCAEHPRWRCLDSGNGLLEPAAGRVVAKHPPAELRRSRLSQRRLGRIETRRPDHPRLLTHIARGEPEERSRQLRTVISLYLDLTAPAILLGDLNSTGDDPQIRRLLAAAGVADAVGKVLGARIGRAASIWIITRGLRPIDAGICDNDASDHPAVWAEVE